MDQESKAPGNVLWGAKAIGEEIGKNTRQTFYVLETGRLPAQRIGRQWVTTRAQLKAWLAGDTGH